MVSENGGVSIRIKFILPDGRERVATARPGDTVMEAATRIGIPGIDGECGGNCACGTCHVYVDDAWFPSVGTPGPFEEAILDMAFEPKPTSRLACQIKIVRELDTFTVFVPARRPL